MRVGGGKHPTPACFSHSLPLKKQKKYYATFGQYVLTPEVYDELAAMVITADNEGYTDEIGLTEALDKVRAKYGMYAFVPDGISYDLGLPEAYRYTVANFGLVK